MHLPLLLGGGVRPFHLTQEGPGHKAESLTEPLDSLYDEQPGQHPHRQLG